MKMSTFLVSLSKADKALWKETHRNMGFFYSRPLDDAFRTWEYRVGAARFKVYWGRSKDDRSGAYCKALNEAAEALQSAIEWGDPSVGQSMLAAVTEEAI